MWARLGSDGPQESCVRWGPDPDPQVLRDIVMATNFWLSVGCNFGCMIASDTLFEGSVFGVKLSHEDIAEIECLTRDFYLHVT